MPNMQTCSEDKINLITIGYKQDPKSDSIKYTKCPGHNQKLLDIQRRNKQTNLTWAMFVNCSSSEMTQTIELSDKNVKANIIKML